MAYEFAELKDIENQVIKLLAAEQQKLKAAKQAFAVIANNLANLQTQYAEWATEVNNYQAANVGNAAAEALKANKDQYVSEFQSTKTEAETLDTTVNPA